MHAGAASIACAEIGPHGDLGEVRQALTAAGHLSYPMVVLDGTDALMVPESAEEGVVRLHRASVFPDSWSVVADLLPEPGVDSTLWHQDGRWVALHDPHRVARGGRDADALSCGRGGWSMDASPAQPDLAGRPYEPRRRELLRRRRSPGPTQP